MKVLVTGAAGFIGSHLIKRLRAEGRVDCVGVDNYSPYYDVELKRDRVDDIERCDIRAADQVRALFRRHDPDVVVNLAAQAGVRHSLECPRDYIDTNITGFQNILDRCEDRPLIYASSSSVYGMRSLYALTKHANEVMAALHTERLGAPTTGLRFFTVYGPWGRPDMALFRFTESILDDRPVTLYNNGCHWRCFTYIDDVVEALRRVIHKPVPGVFDVATDRQSGVSELLGLVEDCLGRKAEVRMLPMQFGDVESVVPHTARFRREYDYTLTTAIEHGIPKFIDWYLERYQQRAA